MAPQPRNQNPQYQPLTTSLRKICRDYPPGAGILTELLQNADDAGATNVRFVLDTGTHPEMPVLVDGLSEFQGPALLAYNDALFSDKDFESLTSVGDSKKLQDKAATGKFGLGFSSIFNWTDCPSVISGSTLLFLDPHHSWSRNFNPPGGPAYDFPAGSKDKSMISHLSCFSLLNQDWERPFVGTIIRIPLRTASQAERSQISTKSTTTDDIQYSMRSFGDEIGSVGLLFLKSVQRIVLEVNGKYLSEVEIINKNDLKGPQKSLRDVINNLVNDKDRVDESIYHEVHLRHRTPDREVVNVFGVLNLVASSINDRELEDWAASEKLFPWVAVAAPLQVRFLKSTDGTNEQVLNADQQSSNSSKSGRLFCTLPLPIFTGLPVNIHGLFSMTADRSRLHGICQDGVLDHRPQLWNKFLFDVMIPNAWCKLLLKIAQKYSTENHFHLWPTNNSSPQELWHGICPAFLAQVSRNTLPIWFTEVGYTALQDGLLASNNTSLEMKKVLREAKLHVIFLADDLLAQACRLVGGRSIHPETLCEHLRRAGSTEKLTGESKLVLLEFLLPEIPLADFGAWEIFPFQDGSFHSLEEQPIFLDRNDLEKKFFTQKQERAIETSQLTEMAVEILHQQAKQNSQIIRCRTTEDLRDYYLDNVANGIGDILVLDDGKTQMLDEIWKWIFEHGGDNLNLSVLGSLWLLPLRGGRVRKLVPGDASNFITWFHSGETNDVSLKIFALDLENAPKVLAKDALSDEVKRRLLQIAVKEPSLHLVDGQNFAGFLSFLTQGRRPLQTAAIGARDSALNTLRRLYLAESPQITDHMCQSFRSLYIFKAVTWPTHIVNPSLTTYTDLAGGYVFIGLKNLVPIPPIANQVFLDASEEGVRLLFEKVGRLKCLTESEILEKLIVPALQNSSYDMLNPELRLQAVNFLFQNHHHICTSMRGCLSDLVVVPIQKPNGEGVLSFGTPSDMLDPQSVVLKSLFFDCEIKYPEESFCRRYQTALIEFGMKQVLSEQLILDRIQVYQGKEYEFDVVAARARNLLQMPFRKDSGNEDFTRIVRQSGWLPAEVSDTCKVLTNAVECRDVNAKSVIGHVWRTLSFPVDESWRSVLGWNNIIPMDVLLLQLVRSIAVSDVHSVEQTLFYLHQHHPVERYVNHLLEMSFVRSANGKLVRATTVCRGGGERLEPYLHVVEQRFWDDHNQLMNMAAIPELPSQQHLEDVQSALEAKGVLDEEDLDVAAEVAHIWSCRFHENVYGLRLPTIGGVLVDVGILSYDDTPWEALGDHLVVHAKISRSIAAQLRIPLRSELLRNGALGISDDEEDEFCQREEVADGIRDTLDRYGRESTFHEYIANSDDCGTASDVNFLFDETTYGSQDILTEELKALQGPALLVHNNGVFTEADFDGLKPVGRGSKRNDPTTIGKFGKGSQTMYHWTDVPMILSGKYLLILDPLRKYLPYRRRNRERKSGIKVEYMKLKSTCPGQLTPFEGIWGFDSNHDSYNGTIFRFPLRKEGDQSELLESLCTPAPSTVIETFRNCFDEARLALLFLRNVTKIDFSLKRGGPSEWIVRRGDWPESDTFSDWANVVAERKDHIGKFTLTTERWLRVIVDVPDAPADLQYRHKRMMKQVECGLAAPWSMKATKSSLQPLRARFFNCLPLIFESSLPVQIHATFLLSSDRKNLVIENTSQDAGSEWNRWLLEKKLPLVYLQFLEDLGRKIGYDLYKYFPTKVSDASDLLSNLIRTSFWREIKVSPCRVFPVTDFPQDCKESNGKNRRTAPHLITFEQSVFDTLDEEFDTLRQLLYGLQKDLVRPPRHLRHHIEDIPGVKLLTPAVVRKVLKSATTEDVENATKIDKDFLSSLLSFIVPKAAEEVIDLDACPVLPLMTGRIGLLSLKPVHKEGNDTKMYFSATAECESIFSFASSIFCERKENGKFVNEIIRSGLLNLKKVECNDVGEILSHRPLSDPRFVSEVWLCQFWSYINATTRSDDHGIRPGSVNLDFLYDTPLILVRDFDGTESVKSLHDFQIEPMVVQSTVSDHSNLFADFPGLLIANSNTLPTSYREDEESLFEPRSLERFLNSISMLAERDGKGFTDYVKAKLKTNNIKTVQEILTMRLSGNNPQLPNLAKTLPVWPSVSVEHGHLTMKEAMVAKNLAFVVPWITDYHRFTDFEVPFETHPINDVSMFEQHVLPAFPEFIDQQTKPSYVKLIVALSRSWSMKRMSLSNHRLAAGQDGVRYYAHDLYDHGDEVFSAAFRHQAETKFLMVEARIHLRFWYGIGLRHRKSGVYRGEDYLACLSVLEDRLTGTHDQQLMTDIEKILRPLCLNDGSLSNLDPSSWDRLSRLRVFPARQESSDLPEYRRHRIQNLSSETNILCLNDIVRYDFASVCWSQIRFPFREPAIHPGRTCGPNGQPTCAVVWQHLAVLAHLAQSIQETDIRQLVDDIQKTYEYLNLNLQDSKDSFGMRTAAIWWNVGAPDSDPVSISSIRSSWTSLENLLLDSSCDALPLVVVQPFLGRFSTLLKTLDCKSVHYPQVNLHDAGRPNMPVALLKGLWQEGVLTDVKFKAEGKEIAAHKVMLASRSLYCKHQFHGPWSSESLRDNTNEAIQMEDISYATLQILIGFCYEENQDWASCWQAAREDSSSTIADKLDSLLDVLTAADRWLMPDLHVDAQRQVMSGIRFFVRPDNVIDVRKIADETNAKELKQYCDEFSIYNEEAILLASADSN